MKIPEATYIEKLKTPFLTWIIGAEDTGIRWIMSDKKADISGINERSNELTRLAVVQLKEYFDGKRIRFELPIDISGYSAFAQSVWQMLLTIPYGKTISYKQLAIMLGDVKCIRAAAAANGKNPIPVIIPCHRVIGSDGSLTGYALGLDVKSYLLNIEQPGKYEEKQLSLFK